MADQLVTLWRYRDLPEALIARAKLDSQLIWCVLADENMVRLNWFISNAVGGVRLQVADEDAPVALDLLGEEIPENFTVEEIGEEYKQPECPNCHSRDTSYEPMHGGLALVCLSVLSLPVWLPKKLWKCEDFGHQWQAEYE